MAEFLIGIGLIAQDNPVFRGDKTNGAARHIKLHHQLCVLRHDTQQQAREVNLLPCFGIERVYPAGRCRADSLLAAQAVIQYLLLVCRRCPFQLTDFRLLPRRQVGKGALLLTDVAGKCRFLAFESLQIGTQFQKCPFAAHLLNLRYRLFPHQAALFRDNLLCQRHPLRLRSNFLLDVFTLLLQAGKTALQRLALVLMNTLLPLDFLFR